MNLEIKTKDDILEDNWSTGLVPTDYPDCIIIHKEEVFNAMSEYARSRAIEFAEWISKNKLVYDFSSWTWLYDHKLYTTSELYELFSHQTEK